MSDMTPQMEKFFEKARSVKLSHAEKDAMRTALKEHMHKEAARPKAPIPSPWQMGQFMVLVHKPVALALIVVLALSGGTAYAAEGALPGDALYTVKVDVVEEVRAALTVSDESRIRWDARRAERRLEEATKLAEKGALTDEREQELEERFEQHAEEVELRAIAVENKGNAHAAAIVLAEFEGVLRGHAEVLAMAEPARAAVAMTMEIATDTSVAEDAPPAESATSMMMTMEAVPEEAPAADEKTFSKRNVEQDTQDVAEKVNKEQSRIAQKVKKRLEQIERKREEAERKADKKNKREAGRRIEDAEQALERVEKKLEERPSREDVRARVRDARVRIEEAKQNEDAGSSTEAFIEAQAAVTVIEESNVLLKVNDEVIMDEHVEGDVDIKVEAESENGRSKVKIRSNILHQDD